MLLGKWKDVVFECGVYGAVANDVAGESALYHLALKKFTTPKRLSIQVSRFFVLEYKCAKGNPDQLTMLQPGGDERLYICLELFAINPMKVLMR